MTVRRLPPPLCEAPRGSFVRFRSGDEDRLLVIRGRRDDDISIGTGERLFALAAGPKRFVVIDKGRHMGARYWP